MSLPHFISYDVSVGTRQVDHVGFLTPASPHFAALYRRSPADGDRIVKLLQISPKGRAADFEMLGRSALVSVIRLKNLVNNIYGNFT